MYRYRHVLRIDFLRYLVGLEWSGLRHSIHLPVTCETAMVGLFIYVIIMSVEQTFTLLRHRDAL